MADYVGSKLRITTHEGKYEGYVHSVDNNNQRISLERVVSCQTGKSLQGVLHFYSHEFKHVEQLEAAETKIMGKEVKTDEEIRGKPMMHRKGPPNHLSKLKNLQEPDLYLGKQVPSSDSNKNHNHMPPAAKSVLKRGTKFSVEPPRDSTPQRNPGLPSRPRNYIVIDQIDNQFMEAMLYVNKQQIVGLAMEGVKLGRGGKLCWVQVGTKEHILLFDILTLGAAAFDRGLGDVLENDSILKVIHDCRRISDILLHQYRVKLVNVFDTQVADVMVYRLVNGNNLPRYVSPLTRCLSEYLELYEDDIYVDRYRINCEEDDQSVWAQRPCPDHVLDAAAKNVVYLKELRVVLLERMMAEFIDGVNIYLENVRDATDQELAEKQPMPHLLPVDFTNLSKKVRSRRETSQDENGFLINCRGVVDPQIVYSHDAIWHKASSGKKVASRELGQGKAPNTDNKSKLEGNLTKTPPSLLSEHTSPPLSVRSRIEGAVHQSSDGIDSVAVRHDSSIGDPDEIQASAVISYPRDTRDLERSERTKPLHAVRSDIVFRPAGVIQDTNPKTKRHPATSASASLSDSEGIVNRRAEQTTCLGDLDSSSFDDIPDLNPKSNSGSAANSDSEALSGYSGDLPLMSSSTGRALPRSCKKKSPPPQNVGRGLKLLALINGDQSLPAVGQNGPSRSVTDTASGQFENADRDVSQTPDNRTFTSVQNAQGNSGNANYLNCRAKNILRMTQT